MLLKLEIGYFDSKVGLNLHLKNDLDALGDFEIEKSNSLGHPLSPLHELSQMD